MPEYTSDITATGTLRLLEGIRETAIKTRFYQASSSEMFGSIPPPQSEDTRFHPRSPYACAKLFAHNITVNYRESYGMFACCGILFNHEAPRRGETFVTRKIARAAAHIKYGFQRKLYLGKPRCPARLGLRPGIRRVEAMWRMLQQDEPRDYVIGTGQMHTVREFVESAFRHAQLDWRDYVETDARYFRPAEVEALQADASKARRDLGWPHKVGFDQLVALMVDAELEDLARRSSGRLRQVAAEGRMA